MCQAVKDLIKDATREANKREKAALKEIERLKAEVRNLQSQLKTA